MGAKRPLRLVFLYSWFRATVIWFLSFSFSKLHCVQRRIQGGVIGAKPPLNQWNLLISGGFHAPTGAEPPLERKKFKPPPWTNSWIRPWLCLMKQTVAQGELKLWSLKQLSAFNCILNLRSIILKFIITK